MSPEKKAKKELDEIRNQKTVTTTRLNRVLDVLDYDELEKRYIQQGKRIRRQKDRLRRFERRESNE